MKIECDKCGAKYSIADEKVRGKTFKIRCKKCSNVIIVRDKAAAAASSPEPEPASAPGWHLAVNGETVGPMTEDDVRARYKSGEIDRETAVWQEGFDDWIPLSDVSAFSDLPARTGPPPVQGADPFASAGRDDYRGGGGGLGLGGAAMGAASSAGESSPRVTNLTGQRNENSVLFSLDNLQAMATGGGAGRSSSGMTSGGGLTPVSSTAQVNVSKPLATSAPTSEGSGLIDIRALGAAVRGDSGPSAPASDGGGPPLDEVLPSFGGSGFAGLAATPLVAQPAADGSDKRNSNVILFGMAGLVVVLLGALGVFAYVLLTRQPEPVERVVIKEAPSVRDAAGADKEDDDEKKKSKDEDAEEDENAKEDADKDEAASAAAAKSDDKGSSARRRRPSSRSRSSSSGGSKPTPTPSSPASDDKPAASAGGGGGGGGGSDELDVDCILNPDLAKCKKGGGGTAKGKSKPAAADPSLPEKLAASDIRSGVEPVKSAAKACGGKHGAPSGTSVKVRMSIQGSSGRVVSAKAEPPHTGTALGNCVAGALKKATFKKFRDSQMGVVYPIRL